MDNWGEQINQEIFDKVKKLLESQKYAVIATNKDKTPYTNIIAYTSTEGLGNIFFATKRDSTKFLNLINNPCVSLLIDDRKNLSSDILNASAVSAEAEVKEINEEKEKLKKLLLEKHPELASFLNEPNCELLKLEVKKYYYVDNFDNKQELSFEKDMVS
jgi:general stress protein 26